MLDKIVVAKSWNDWNASDFLLDGAHDISHVFVDGGTVLLGDVEDLLVGYQRLNDHAMTVQISVDKDNFRLVRRWILEFILDQGVKDVMEEFWRSVLAIHPKIKLTWTSN